MSKKEKNQIPTTYTNFTAYGLTFCTEVEPSQLKPKNKTLPITSCIVYKTITNPNDANRVRVADGSLHKKITLDGTPKEELIYLDDHNLMELLSFLYLMNDNNERIVAVPASEIDTLYSPRESLLKILMDRVPGLPKEIVHKVKKAVSYLVENGIPLEDIGVYGGLQTFMIHFDPNLRGKASDSAPLKDIDLVIYGLKYVHGVKTLAEKNIKYKKAGKNTRVSHVSEEIRSRRHELSRIYIPNDQDGLFCDIKIVRDMDDRNLFSSEFSLTGKDIVLSGTVIDAKESLCSTPVFQLLIRDIGIVTISSSKYNFIAAVSEGDVIRTRVACTTNDKYFSLSDPQSHYISYISKCKMK